MNHMLITIDCIGLVSHHTSGPEGSGLPGVNHLRSSDSALRSILPNRISRSRTSPILMRSKVFHWNRCVSCFWVNGDRLFPNTSTARMIPYRVLRFISRGGLLSKRSKLSMKIGPPLPCQFTSVGRSHPSFASARTKSPPSSALI